MYTIIMLVLQKKDVGVACMETRLYNNNYAIKLNIKRSTLLNTMYRQSYVKVILAHILLSVAV